VHKGGPVSCLPLPLPLAMAMAVALAMTVAVAGYDYGYGSGSGFEQADANCDKLLHVPLTEIARATVKCTSACPTTISMPRYIRKQADRQAGRQAGTGIGPAMSLIVILDFGEVGQM